MFKNRIKERRQELGLSQTQVAAKAGMATSTLSRIETGNWRPYPKAIRDIAKVLRAPKEFLFPEEFSY